ncbi:MAG: XdhC family protein [Ignavibacteria bacterium]|nr:XdhC family protein [Ignavibacteria bacterium]
MDILSEIKTALDNLERVVIATTITSSGSTPLPSGAVLVFKPVGEIVIGTVGGGILEARVIDQVKAMVSQRGASFVLTFELSDTKSEGGMICGGSVDVLFEVIEDSDRLIFSKLHSARHEGQDCALLRMLDERQTVIDRMVLENLSTGTHLLEQSAPLRGKLQISPDDFSKAIERTHRQEVPVRIPGKSGELLLQPIAGLQPLIVFGGGHIARAVSQIASAAGFRVTIVDDREEYANPRRFPDAVRIILMPIDVAFDHFEIKDSTSVVIVTRGHQLDGEVLARAIKTSARYIGMIGSKRKVIATYERLLQDGVSLDALKRVHAPIGLDIGAVTAEEIAVSIVAELIRVRRGMEKPSVPMSESVKPWFNKQGGGSGTY